MVAHADEGFVFLLKKLGGMFSIIFGCLLTAVGITFESHSVAVLGVLFLVLGAVLLTLKIIRRNRGDQLG
jgi:drug/metabolite transporter (DMT)-like permease